MLNEIISLIRGMSRRALQLERGAFLFHQGDKVKSVFFVEAGSVELTRFQADGGSVVLQRAGLNTVLAEASVYAANYHCNAIAVEASTVMTVPKPVFLKELRRDSAFSERWAAHLADQLQSARYRSEILSRNTVADRLDGWLVWKGGDLPGKGEWKQLATELAVSPEALYRELAKRRR